MNQCHRLKPRIHQRYDRAKQVLNGRPIEVWDGARQIAKLDPKDK
jgi:hypothetical protein